MKLLLIILFFVSCQQADQASSANKNDSDKIGDQANDKIDTIANAIEESLVELVEGSYKSECIPDNDDGHYFIIEVYSYEIIVNKFNSRAGDNCSSFESKVVARYDIVNSRPEFKESEYSYVDSEYNDATYVCGQSHMVGNSNYNIDGINCEFSFENKKAEFKNSNNNYMYNDVLVEKIN